MKQEQFFQGVKSAIPVMAGYFPIGLAFGVLAVQEGLSVVDAAGMSFIVYAGASQFVAVGMLAMGASTSSIVLAAFLVNLRHLLMGASLSPYLKHIKPLAIAAISYGITDETYAVSITEAEKEKKQKGYFFGLHISAQLTWAGSTVLGALLGRVIPEAARGILGFALPAMFIGLLLMQIKNKTTVYIAVISGMLSILIMSIMDGNWNIIAATVAAATIGVCMEKWIKKYSLSL